ncbi:MAG TPA: FecR family protein [Thermoanaerobaculia bacterium]|nr:FecR family protein [Thermoanaerobaculia bacterium]
MNDDEMVRELLQGAGPRRPLPADDLVSIREAARIEWRHRYGRAASPWSFRPWIAVAAAGLLAVAGLVWWARARQAASGSAVASIERAAGVGKWRTGDSLRGGSEIETRSELDGAGRLALRMAGGASVRLDSDTSVRLASAREVELDRGAVYVDTGAGPGRGEEVAVRTPAGLFVGLGTQFEVRAEESAGTRLRVREGNVRLDRGGSPVLTGAGRELVVRGDGTLSEGAIAISGPQWDWVLATAPTIEIEGVKVVRFLDWIARETGWRVEYADEEATSLADSVELHGSIAGLTPVDATGVVLSSAGLGYRVSDGTLVVFVAKK